MTEVVLRTRQLTKRFGRVLAVERLDLEVYRGQVFGFIGPNGAGKTTTIGMLVGLLTPSSGTIELLGMDRESDLAQARQRIGALVERGGFLPYLTGYENLEVMARTVGISTAWRVTDALDLVKLTSKARIRYGTYSQGMRRRLELAASLLRDPDLLILDEPLNGLDPQGMHQVRQLLAQLAASGKAVFLSSHWLHDVEQICHRVAIINQGQVVRMGELAALMRDNRYIRLRIADPESCAAILREVNWIDRVEVTDEWLMVYAPVERSAEVSAVLAQYGHYPAELLIVGMTLEDYFISVTKGQTDV
jgi:ABC-2 type transport system ATP-binding protein